MLFFKKRRDEVRTVGNFVITISEHTITAKTISGAWSMSFAEGTTSHTMLSMLLAKDEQLIIQETLTLYYGCSLLFSDAKFGIGVRKLLDKSLDRIEAMTESKDEDKILRDEALKQEAKEAVLASVESRKRVSSKKKKEKGGDKDAK